MTDLKYKTILSHVIIGILAIMFSGCTVPQPIPQPRLQEFSEAVSMTAENNMSAYTEIEKVHREVDVLKITADFDNKGFKPESIKPFFDMQALKVRRQVLDGLCIYAEKLSELAGEKQLEDFDEETRKLGASLQELNAGLMKSSFFRNSPVESSQIQIFTTAVNAIGRWLIEYRRDRAIRESIVGMDGNVHEICKLFVEDLGSPANGLYKNPGGLRAQQWNQYDELMILQDKFIGDNRNKLDPAVKKQEIEKLASYPARQKESDAALADIQSSFRKIREIHDALVKASGDGVRDYEAMVKKLISEGKRINKFYKGLGKDD